nr:MAG TPA: hypothetical protein [Caudoviricetes sp.]
MCGISIIQNSRHQGRVLRSINIKSPILIICMARVIHSGRQSAQSGSMIFSDE